MNVDSIQNGIVIDHITAGQGMRLYELLGLDGLDVSVALIKNVVSKNAKKPQSLSLKEPKLSIAQKLLKLLRHLEFTSILRVSL